MKYTLIIESNDVQDLRRFFSTDPIKITDTILHEELSPEISAPREIQFGDNPYKKCLECGKEFIPKRGNSNYCSKKCGNAKAYRKWYSRKQAQRVDLKLKKIKKEIPIVEKQLPVIFRDC